MNPPTPHPNDEDALRAALRRDAARVTEPAFDAALHHNTMRRLRGMAAPTPGTSRWPVMLRLAAGAAVIALAVFLARELPESAGRKAAQVSPQIVAPAPGASRASVLAYRTAASEGDEALLAMLDRDARDLLPTPSAVFASPLR